MKEDPISSTEVQLTRWLDHAPGATPPENMDPGECARQRARSEAVAALLRRHAPTAVEPPYPEFFNSQLLKRIRDEHDQGRAAAASEAGGFWPALGAWLRSPWLATAAAAAVLVVVTWRSPGGGEAASGTRVLSVFSPEPNASARIHQANGQDAVIITVDGLEAFPSDRAVAGCLNDESRPLVALHQP